MAGPITLKKIKLGPEVSEAPLVSAEALTERRDRLSTEQETLERFLPAWIPGHRFFAVGGATLEPPARPRQVLQRLGELHRRVEERRASILDAYRRHGAQAERRQDALSAQALLEAGLEPDAETFHLPRGDRAGVERALQRAAANLETSAGEIDSFESLAAERLRCALTLLVHPRVQERLGAAARSPEDVGRWLRAHAELRAHEPALRTLRDGHVRLATLLANHEGHEEHRPLVDAILREGEEVFRAMEAVLGQLREVAFPFDHGKDRLSVAQHLLPEATPEPGDPGAVEGAARSLLERAAQLHDRTLAALTAAAEPVEELFGIQRRGGA